jgi:hypothetical protein
MRDPTTDVYACLVSFVGQTGPEQPRVAHLLLQYAEFADVASEDDAKGLAEHSSNDLSIELTPGTQLPHQPLYNLSATELEVLRAYLTEYMARGWI